MDYFVWQNVPQVCCSFEEEILFEIFEAVTSHLDGYDMKTIAFVHFVYIMHNFVHLNEIASFSSLN